MSDAAQNFASHRRFIPLYHFFTLPVLLINAIYSVVRIFAAFSFGTVFTAVVAFALLFAAFFPRAFVAAVQDRVIRLEEQLRLERLLPDDLKSRTGEFSVAQLVGLRFASDEELPGLARKVLDEKIANRDEIKKLVTTWRPDYVRA